MNVLNLQSGSDNCATNTQFIQKSINYCFERGGGEICIPNGTFYVGALFLRDNVSINLLPGAILKASGNKEDYIVNGELQKALLNAFDSKNISVYGNGKIDGNCIEYQDIITKLDQKEVHISGKKDFRPKMVYFENCIELSFLNIFIENAPFWTMHFLGCEDVIIDSIRIKNPLNLANSDGIDPDHCKNFRISNCHIECADDCIVMKNTYGGLKYGACENITISNCTLISTSAGVKIGTESYSDFKNIVVSNCTISRSNRGLAIQLRDNGNVENILYNNITIETRRFYSRWWGKAEPIYVTVNKRYEDSELGSLKNIYFNNISCKGENGIFIRGVEDNIIKNINLSNINLEILNESKWEKGIYEFRPSYLEGLIYKPTSAIFGEYVDGINLENINVIFSETLDDTYSDLYDFNSVNDVSANNVKFKDNRKSNI